MIDAVVSSSRPRCRAPSRPHRRTPCKVVSRSLSPCPRSVSPPSRAPSSARAPPAASVGRTRCRPSLYGHGTDPRHISLPGHELMLALKTAERPAHPRARRGKDELALPKDVQRDPIKGFLEHVDLVVVRRGEKVTVEIRHPPSPARPRPRPWSTSTTHDAVGRGRGDQHPDRRRRLRRGPRGRRPDPRQGRDAARRRHPGHRRRTPSSSTSPPPRRPSSSRPSSPRPRPRSASSTRPPTRSRPPRPRLPPRARAKARPPSPAARLPQGESAEDKGDS